MFCALQLLISRSEGRERKGDKFQDPDKECPGIPEWPIIARDYAREAL